MAPRAVLLTGDEKVSALLSAAIAEACKLDCCKDIFSAVEAVTRDHFNLLLIDWQEELEADFLLKTARDLKSTRTFFAVGLVTPAQRREALESGADALLLKPFTEDQAAEMLLPQLGIEPSPVRRGSDSPAERDNPASKPHIPILPVSEATPQTARASASEPRIPIQTMSARHHCALEPSPPILSRRSRTLSLTAVVWPLVIVVALLAFDQWPQLSRRTYSGFSGLLRVVHGRVVSFPESWTRASSPAANNRHSTPDGAAIPLTGDLLSDYASPPTAPEAAREQNLSLNKPEDIDLASIEALPSTSRLMAPVFAVEPSPAPHEIPASLRFPPPAETARTVTPTGQLVAPGWGEAPIALPETVSRALLEHQVAPRFPDQALQMGVDGPVVLQASISKDGAVRELKLVSGYLVLAHAAVDAVKQWRYKPYRRNGENVEIETLITVNFKRPPRG